jgi:hypothetical protein
MSPASTTAAVAHASELYLHVRVLLGMVVGLGLTHLLRHFARIVEHPAKVRVYWVHLVWALSTFLFLLHFWWWEFRLAAIPDWTFPRYLFVVLYALLLYLLCALVFPEHLDEYDGYRGYFYARRRWIFGTLALVYVFDYADTLLKGVDYLYSFGSEYDIRNSAYVLLCVVAMTTRRSWFHATFAVVGLVYQLSWIIRMFDTL